MLAILAILCVFCTVGYIIVSIPSYRRRRKFLDIIPSPEGTPFIGHALNLRNSVEIFEKFKQWTKEKGKLMVLHAGPYIIYVTSDVSLVEKVFSSNTLITKGWFYRFVMPWLKEGLITSTGAKWKGRRRAITPTFHFNILDKFIDVFEKHGKSFVKVLEKEVGKPSVEIFNLTSLCTLDIICDTAMGVHHNAQETQHSEYVKATKFLAKNVMERSFSLIGQNDFVYSFTPTYREEQRNLKIVHDFADKVIKQRREELAQKKPNTTDVNEFGMKKRVAFLDLLLETTIDGKSLSNSDIREEVDSFMFAGHDTTATTLSFVFYSLAKYPTVQQKVYDEVMEILGENSNRSFKYADLQNMKYTDMVMRETMRIYTTVPYIGREVTEDFEHNGYRFLKGSTILLYIYGMHIDPNNFSNPHDFIPERWNKAMDSNMAYSYTPFSAGPRNCVGQKFAMLEMKSLIADVVKNFVIVPSNPQKELILANEGVLKSVTGVHIAFEKRH